MARRRFAKMPESQMRKKTWIQANDPSGITPSATDAALTQIRLALTAPGAGKGRYSGQFFALIDDTTELSSIPEESTILRMRGELSMPDNVVALQGLDFAFGIGITDVRSLLGGSPPNPAADPSWDGWMFLRHGFQTENEIGTGGYGDHVMDVKAKRKIRGGEALFFAATQQNTGASSSGISADVGFTARLLTLLP